MSTTSDARPTSQVKSGGYSEGSPATKVSLDHAVTAYRVADTVVWIGCADIGIAPALPPPLSWWLGWRCRRAMRTIGRVARSGGAPFVDFATPEHSARFRAARRHYFAADGLHPSAAAYRECFEIVLRTVPAISRLARAPRRPVAPPA